MFAIALQVHRPTDFFLWLEHHRRLGVSEFHILADDSPDLEVALAAAGVAPDCHVTTRTPGAWPQQSQVERQIAFVNAVLRRTNARWLIHIDADELLEGRPEWLDLLPSTVAAVKLENVEAVYTGTERHCFAATEFVRCSRAAGCRCRSYVNGKVAIRVGGGAQLWGAHDATVPTLPIPLSSLHVRHFESCTFAAWAEKMLRVARTGQTHARPFPFYAAAAAALLPAYRLYREVTGSSLPRPLLSAEYRADQETGPHGPTCRPESLARPVPPAPLPVPQYPHPSSYHVHRIQ